MTAIKRQRPPKHAVLVDTNVLWHEDKSVVVSPQFDKFWAECASKYALELIVPEVVSGEILYQQTCSALKALAKVTENLEKVCSITGRRYELPVSEPIVRADVSRRFDAWLKSKQALVEETPAAKVDWSSMVKSAIWREPPFTADAKNPENEKGFRDALILETVASVAERSSGRKPVAFICADKLLRSSAEKRLEHIPHAACYESPEHFRSYLRLSDEKLTEEFVRAIQLKAFWKFLELCESPPAAFGESIFQRIAKQFANEFTSTDFPPSSTVAGSQSTEPSFAWLALHQGNWASAAPIFEKLEHDREFYWSNMLFFTRCYRSALFGSGGTQPQSERRLQVLTFRVRWSSRVAEDGRFLTRKILGYELIERRFAAPTEEDLKRHGIPERAWLTQVCT